MLNYKIDLGTTSGQVRREHVDDINHCRPLDISDEGKGESFRIKFWYARVLDSGQVFSRSSCSRTIGTFGSNYQ